jgi:mycoredoxin
MTSAATPTQIDLYWRPGCGFCAMLRRKLDKLGVERVEHNIWDNPDAAATVRRHARGNETVPTVVVGGTGLVNPSADKLIADLEAEAPELIPADLEPAEPGVVGRLMNRVLGG